MSTNPLSNYPTGFDATFPGYPYQDFTEYVTAEQANAWIAAIQNLESTVGYGSTVNNPLFSLAYNTTFASLAAGSTSRMAALEEIVLNLTNTIANFNTLGPAVIGSGLLWFSDVIPTNYLALQGQTIIGGAISLPILAAAYPAWVSGNNLVLPDARNNFLVGSQGLYPTGSKGGNANIVLSAAQIPRFVVGVAFTDNGHSHVDSGHIHAIQNGPYQFIVGSIPNSTIYTNSGANVDHSPAWNLTAQPETGVGNAQIQASTTGISASVTFGQVSPSVVPTLPPYLAVNVIVRKQ
jgi:hypothetical protein